MQVITTEFARDAIAELREIATQGIVDGDSPQKLLSALRQVVRTARSSENAIMLLSQRNDALLGEQKHGDG